MSTVTANPTIDRVTEQANIFYVDDGCAVFRSVGDPEGLIAANAGSFAIDVAGNWYRKTTNTVATGWTAAGGGGGGTPGGNNESIQFNNAGSFDGSDALQWDDATQTLGIGEAGVSAGKIELRNATNANLLTIQAGVLTPASYTLTLPVNDGSSLYFLQTNGSGVTSWAYAVTGPGGILNSVQYNNGGGLIEGDAGFIFDPVSNTVDIGTSSVLDGKLRFKNSTNANIATIQAGVFTGNYTLTLPVDDGASGQYLQTNGSGVLSWQTVSASSLWSALGNPTGNLSLAMAAFTTSFTWGSDFGANNAFDIQGTNTSATGALVRIRTAVSTLQQPFLVEARTGQSIKADHLRNVIVGQDNVASGATDGYAHIGFIASQAEPSGAPTLYSGYAPLILENDAINGHYRLWSYLSSGWRNLSLGATGTSGTVQYNNNGTQDSAAGFIWQNASPNVTITAQNNAHVAFVVNSGASPSANIAEIQRNGTIAFRITSAGAISSQSGTGTEKFGAGSSATGVGGLAIGGSAAAIADFTTSIGNSAQSNNNGVAVGALSSCNNGGVAIGAAAGSFSFSNFVAIGYAAVPTANNQLVIGSNSANITDGYIGNGVVNASPVGFILNATGGSGSNIAGGALSLAGGKGTGTGNGGNVNFQIALAGSSGSSLNALTTFSRVNGTLGYTEVLAGRSSTFAKVGGVLNVNTTQVGNVGAGEDDLITYTVPANTLATNGESLEAEMFGNFTANANNKRIRVYFGATVLFDTTALAFNGDDWSIKVKVIRITATTQLTSTQFITNGSTLAVSTLWSSPAETLSGAVVLKTTGEATNDNDIEQLAMCVKWFANGN